ncbi:MAG: hypothetical protein ACTSVY_03925 [Candidatus Helarchaeota archaeon]
MEKKRLLEQSATGKSVFMFTNLTSVFYFLALALILPFPNMVNLTFTFKLNNILLAIFNLICGIGLVSSTIFIKKRQYYLGSSLILGFSIFGFVIGGGFLVAPLWGFANALIGFITGPLETKLYERKMEN